MRTVFKIRLYPRLSGKRECLSFYTRPGISLQHFLAPPEKKGLENLYDFSIPTPCCSRLSSAILIYEDVSVSAALRINELIERRDRIQKLSGDLHSGKTRDLKHGAEYFGIYVHILYALPTSSSSLNVVLPGPPTFSGTEILYLGLFQSPAELFASALLRISSSAARAILLLDLHRPPLEEGLFVTA